MHVSTPIAQKHRVLATGIISKDYVPMGCSVNASYILRFQGRFTKKFRQKQPLQTSQECFFP